MDIFLGGSDVKKYYRWNYRNETNFKLIRKALADYLGDSIGDIPLTLCFNPRIQHQPLSRSYLEETFYHYINCINSKLFGKYWWKKDCEKVGCVGVLEHENSNAHIHCIVRCPIENKVEFIRIYESIWENIVPSGDAKINKPKNTSEQVANDKKLTTLQKAIKIKDHEPKKWESVNYEPNIIYSEYWGEEYLMKDIWNTDCFDNVFWYVEKSIIL